MIPEKWIKVIVWISMTLVIGLVVFLLVTNILNNCDFTTTSLDSLITILIVVFIGYFLVQQKEQNSKLKNQIVVIAVLIQELVKNKDAYSVLGKQEILEYKRKINNLISSIENCKKKVNINEDIEFLRSKFDLYDDFIGNHIHDIAYLQQKESVDELKKNLSLIDDACYRIRTNLYNK